MNEPANPAPSVPKDMGEAKSILRAVLDELSRFPRDYDAQPVPESLSAARALLGNDNRDIVVCGEARQGKSSFINALLGKKILPVDVVVTTSQVFRIAHAERESFFLVFEDGLRIEISKDDLEKYGRQSDESLADEPLFAGRTLQWIEVNTPAAKLPEGVHLLDTPGLGTLYARHADIALRHIEAADAVIFVKDVDAPLKESDLAMLETIFAVTENVLFVLSQKDKLYDDELAEMAGRDEEILNERFGKRLRRSFHFWPVSSRERMEADPARPGEDESGFPEMLGALSNLFERTTGLACSQLAHSEASAYLGRCGQFRKERQAALAAGPSPQVTAWLKEKQAKKAEFNGKWGPQGTKKTAFQTRVQHAVARANTLFANVFPEVRSLFARRISRLDTDAELESMSRTLVDDICGEVQKKFTAITQAVAEEFRTLSSDLSEAMALDVPAVSTVPGEVDTGSGLSRLGAGISGALSAAWKASIVLGVAGMAGVSVQAVVTAALGFTGPVGWCIAGVLAWATGASIGAKVRQQHAQARQQLLQGVHDVLEELQKKMLTGTGMDDPPIRKWLEDAQKRAMSAATEMAQAELDNMQGEIRRLEADVQADEDKRKALQVKMGNLEKALETLRPRLDGVREYLEGYVRDGRHAM